MFVAWGKGDFQSALETIEGIDELNTLATPRLLAVDGHILMKVHPELSDGVVTEGLPSKTTAEVTTEVLIKNGDTLFIGGLIRERTEEIRRGIPLLVRIPLLGALFGKTTYVTSKSELITLITPTIIQPGDDVEY